MPNAWNEVSAIPLACKKYEIIATQIGEYLKLVKDGMRP